MEITLVALMFWGTIFLIIRCSEKQTEREHIQEQSNQRRQHEQELVKAKDEHTRKPHEDWLKAHAKWVEICKPKDYFYLYIEPELIAQRRNRERAEAIMNAAIARRNQERLLEGKHLE